MTALSIPKPGATAQVIALLASPVVLIFLSSNFVNVGNLAFNMIFSRWMGPALFGDLAVVLTIKLAILGVFGALSSATSQQVAAVDGGTRHQTEQALAAMSRVCFVGLWIALPVIAVVIYAGSLSSRLDLGSPYLLFILLGTLPFCGPLNLLRGVALGRMDSTRFVYSANAEMAVRLGVGIVAWQLGFGIEGVVAAIGLSIVAGWIVLVGVLPKPQQTMAKARPVAITLGLAALPFAVLQLAQVVTLDGDIFLAKRYLGDQETGFVAALSLFQRIQFFACFALASVLLPSVVIAIREERSYRKSIAMIGALLAVVSTIVLAGSFFAPKLLLTLLVGADYAAAAVHLIWVAAAAVLFTVNYLIATFLLAQNNRSGVIVVMIGCIVQIAVMTYTVSGPNGDLAALIFVKLLCQLGTLIALALSLRITMRGVSAVAG